MRNGAAGTGLVFYIIVLTTLIQTFASTQFFLYFAAVISSIAALATLIYYLQPQCSKCGSRSRGHVHSRIDGGPDRRYSYNPVVCKRCGEPHR